MSYRYRFSVLLGLALGGFGVAGCGGDDGAECGEGTTEVGGVCIPTELVCAEGTVWNETTMSCELDQPEIPSCGAGTIRMDDECVPTEEPLVCADGTTELDGECVVDGTVVCTGNTVFDMETGECMQDPEAVCEFDLVYVEDTGTCVPRDSTLMDMADVVEDGDAPDFFEDEDAEFGEIDLPDDGSAVSVWGCVEPQVDEETGLTVSDNDFWTFTVDGPTLLEVVTDGVWGLSAGAQILSAEGEGTPIFDQAWNRFVVDLAGDGTTQQVFIPEAGSYYIRFTDSRSAIFGEPAGTPAGAETPQCYFNQLSVLDIPEPTTLEDGTAVVGEFGDPQFYEISGDVIDVTLDEIDEDGNPINRENLAGGFVATVADEFRAVSEVTTETDFFGLPLGPLAASAFVGNIGDGESVLIVVDARFNLVRDAIEFRLLAENTEATELPMDDTVTVTHTDIDDPDNVLEHTFFSFTAEAGQVVQITFDGSPNEFSAAIIDGTAVGWRLGSAAGVSVSTFDHYVSIPSDGTYYLTLQNLDGTDGEDYTFDVTWRAITPVMETRDTATTADLTSEEFAFVNADLTTTGWVMAEAGGFTGAMTDTTLEMWDATQLNVLDITLPLETETLEDGEGFERIFYGADGTPAGPMALVRISGDDTGTVDVTMTDVDHTVVEYEIGTDTMLDDEDVPADGAANYVAILSDVLPDDTALYFDVTEVAAEVDAVLDFLDFEATPSATTDVAGDGGDEFAFSTLAGRVLPFRVTDANATGGTVDITLREDVAPGYDSELVDAGTLTADVCTDGTETLTGEIDMFSENIDMSGLDWVFFGLPAPDMAKISSNGGFTFDVEHTSTFSTVTGASLTVSPLEAFLQPGASGRVCYLLDETENTFVVQWFGERFASAEPVEMEARVDGDTGIIEMVYGAAHMATGPVRLRDGAGAAVDYEGDAPTASQTVRWTPR